jgi:hypothetical protein
MSQETKEVLFERFWELLFVIEIFGFAILALAL